MLFFFFFYSRLFMCKDRGLGGGRGLHWDVRGTLTAPVSVEVSVEVDPEAAAAPADRAVLPPHSVLGQQGLGHESIVSPFCHNRSIS